MPVNQITPTAASVQLQFSTTLLSGALWRGTSGRYFWRGDDSLAEHVIDLRIGRLLPRFRITRRYDHTHYAVPLDWQRIYQWQGDALLAQMVNDCIASCGRESLVGGDRIEMVDPPTAVRRKKVLGALIPVVDLDSILDLPIPAWPVQHAAAVLSAARVRATQYFCDQDLASSADRMRRMFFSADGLARYGQAGACLAAAAWGTMEEHLREAYDVGASRHGLWQLEAALDELEAALPPNWSLLGHEDLERLASRFGPLAETRRQA